MTGDQPLALRCGEALRARIVAIVRNHHDIMPGASRDRPGVDRIRIEAPLVGERQADVWSGTTQDIATAGEWIEIYERDGTLCWRATEGASPSPDQPANDQYGATEGDRRGARATKVASG